MQALDRIRKERRGRQNMDLCHHRIAGQAESGNHIGDHELIGRRIVLRARCVPRRPPRLARYLVVTGSLGLVRLSLRA